MVEDRSGGGDIHRSLALMWEYDERPTRGPRPQLSLSAIVERAVQVADAEGLEALSMRRVAADLGVGTMSLYRYVPGKAELLDLMLEHVAAPDSDTPLPSGWRPAMEALGWSLWRLYTTHPWLPFVDQTRPVLGPNALGGLDVALAGLEDTGLDDPQKIAVINTLEVFASGAARGHNSLVRAERESGVSTEEFWQAQAPVLVSAMATGRYPRMAALSDDAFAATGEQLFGFGLERILDGLAVLVDGGPAG